MADFQKRIEELDLSLFENIMSESSNDDKRSLLTLQRFTRQSRPKYTYLEIGSHLGGTLQSHLIDPRCVRIFSIDPRPLTQPDERTPTFEYQDNSTQRMLDNLRRISSVDVLKIVSFESDATDLPQEAIDVAPNLCFIDGEHTNGAVISDFRYCKSVCSADAVICFHDDWVVHEGLWSICKILDASKSGFGARKLPGNVFAIALGSSAKREEFRRLGEDGLRWLKIRRADGWLEARLPAGLKPLGRKALHFLTTRR